SSTGFYTLSLHDALPISYTLCVRFDDTTEQTIDFEPILEGELYGPLRDLTLNSLSKSELIPTPRLWRGPTGRTSIQQLCTTGPRSEEHTSELQSRGHLVC